MAKGSTNGAADGAQVIATDGLPEAAAAVSKKASAAISVHSDRGIGGRFVSTGGGERVWVDEGQSEELRPTDDSKSG